ncbi:MAG: AraC family transcriptional regulator [Bacteroidota bacterium]
MDFEVTADVIPLVNGLVTGLTPYAKAQDVDLKFLSPEQQLFVSYNPKKILSEITVLLSRIITFTPQEHHVTVKIYNSSNDSSCSTISIENTGVDLSKLGELISAISYGLRIEKKPNGTCYHIEVPSGQSLLKSPQSSSHDFLPTQYPMYYTTIHKRLTNYFDNVENIESMVAAKSQTEGIFLKKVNAVIRSNLHNSNFSIDHLAGAMALSRTQLFRKVKKLTQMSPTQYVRFTRLQEAKKLLQTTQDERTVSEICYSVGFLNLSHFTRSFKAQFGMNPSSLRKQ